MHGAIPRWLGALVMLAGVMYAVDALAHAALAGYARFADAFEVAVAVPAIVGELGLAVWLLMRPRGDRDAAPVPETAPDGPASRPV